MMILYCFEYVGCWLVLVVVCMVGLVLLLFFIGVVVVMLVIGCVLGGSVMVFNWVVNGFMFVFGSCLMVVGVMVDLYGCKCVFVSGIVLFVLVLIGVVLVFSVNVIGWLCVL